LRDFDQDFELYFTKGDQGIYVAAVKIKTNKKKEITGLQGEKLEQNLKNIFYLLLFNSNKKTNCYKNNSQLKYLLGILMDISSYLHV